MAEFEPAVELVLKHEGGWVNNPNDPGGETNFGISKRFLISHGKAAVVVKDLTPDDAKEIYREFFWNPNSYKDFTDQTIATKVFDASVNMGPQQANRILQRALNKIGNESLVPDGFVGSQTIGLVNKVSPTMLLGALCEELVAFYEGLIKKNPKLAEFRTNWVHRASWRG